MDYLVLEYSNEKDFAGIIYQTGFTNRLYLDVDIGIPEYETVEESELDGENNEKPTFQKVQKKYKIEFVCPEYILDALYLVRLHDNIFVKLKNNESSKIDTFEITHSWINEDGWAKTLIVFTIDYVVKVGYLENEKLQLKTIANKETVTDLIRPFDPEFTNPVLNGVRDGMVFALKKEDGFSLNTGVVKFKTRIDDYESLTAPELFGTNIETKADTSRKADNWIFNETDSKVYNYDKDNDTYKEAPVILELTSSGLDITVRGYSFEGTYAQVLYRELATGSFVNFGDAVMIEQLKGEGVTEEVLASKTYEFKFASYTHGEDLGESPVVTIVIP